MLKQLAVGAQKSCAAIFIGLVCKNAIILSCFQSGAGVVPAIFSRDQNILFQTLFGSQLKGTWRKRRQLRPAQ